MPQLIVRKIENAVVSKLRQKAAREGVSMEEEHRRILRGALLGNGPGAKQNLKDYLRSMPRVGEDSDFARPAAKLRKIEL